MSPAAAPQAGGWLAAIKVYRQPRVAAMLMLGFSAGLPFLLVFSTLSAWLSQAQIERATIGMMSWVGWPTPSSFSGRRWWTGCRCRA